MMIGESQKNKQLIVVPLREFFQTILSNPLLVCFPTFWNPKNAFETWLQGANLIISFFQIFLIEIIPV